MGYVSSTPIQCEESEKFKNTKIKEEMKLALYIYRGNSIQKEELTIAQIENNTDKDQN